MELYHQYVNSFVTTNLTTLPGQNYFNKYTAGNWAGGNFTYNLETTMKSSSATDTVTAQICYKNSTACDTTVGNTVTTNSTAPALVRSTAFASAPPDGQNLDTGIKVTSGADTITLDGSSLIIGVANLQTPENLLLFLPLALFLPAVVRFFKRYPQRTQRILGGLYP